MLEIILIVIGASFAMVFVNYLVLILYALTYHIYVESKISLSLFLDKNGHDWEERHTLPLAIIRCKNCNKTYRDNTKCSEGKLNRLLM